MMFMKANSKVIATSFLICTFNFTVARQTAFPQARRGTSTDADQIVLLTTVVNKKGNLVAGLRRDNFQIVVDKKPASILDFREEDVPLSVGLIFDASGSVV